MSTWETVRHQVAIAGHVVEQALDDPAKRPLEGVTVTFVGQGKMTRTARGGLFYFLDLPDGDYGLKAELPGVTTRYAAAEVVAHVVRNGDRITWQFLEIPLRPTVIRGKVTGPADELVVLAEVRLRGSSERAYTDSQGVYRLVGVETGARTVVVVHPNYAVATQTAPLNAPGDVVTADFKLAPPPV